MGCKCKISVEINSNVSKVIQANSLLFNFQMKSPCYLVTLSLESSDFQTFLKQYVILGALITVGFHLWEIRPTVALCYLFFRPVVVFDEVSCSTLCHFRPAVVFDERFSTKWFSTNCRKQIPSMVRWMDDDLCVVASASNK